jgi:thymidylate kinase
MTSLIRGAILEGTSAAGKTSVLKALKRRQAELELERSVVILGEHYSQALQRVHGEYAILPVDEHRRLLGERLEALDALQRWSSKLGPTERDARGVFFVLERFHLNHRMSYATELEWIESVEARLAGLHAVCFLVTVSEALVPERVAWRLRASGKPHEPSDVEKAARIFVEQQQRFLEAAERSKLRTVCVSTDDRNWDRCAQEILDEIG